MKKSRSVRNLSALSLFVAASLLLFTDTASGKILVTSVTGASRYTLATEEAPTVSIFGGTAGAACTSSGNTTTCNSCATATGLTACNPTRIYSALILRVLFTSDSQSGHPIIAASQDTNGSKIGTITTAVVAANSTAVAQATWSDICTALGSDANCDSALDDLSIKVGIDVDNNGRLDGSDDSVIISIKVADPNKGTDGTNNNSFNTNKGCNPAVADADAGICDFTVSSGDSKAFMQELEMGTASTNTPIVGMRVLVSETDFVCDPTEVDSVQDLNISTTESNEISLDNSIVEGLSNGTLYYFRVASIDAAGNIFAYTDDSVISSACGLSYACGGSRSVASIDPLCPYIGRPDEVLGLLTEDFNCFIATAAYGSPLDAHLTAMRAFRSQILNKFELGKKFVNFYYKKGPYAAKWVADHPWSRPLIQVFIWPLWLFAWISVNWGLGVAFSLLFIGITLPLGVVLYLRTDDKREEKAFG